MIINSTVATIITPDNKQLSHSYKRWSPGIWKLPFGCCGFCHLKGDDCFFCRLD
jgi:hypothetical protein